MNTRKKTKCGNNSRASVGPLENCPWIGAQNLELGGLTLQSFQRLRECRVATVTVYIDEEDIVPLPSPRGSGFNPGHADAMFGKRAQHGM